MLYYIESSLSEFFHARLKNNYSIGLWVTQNDYYFLVTVKRFDACHIPNCRFSPRVTKVTPTKELIEATVLFISEKYNLVEENKLSKMDLFNPVLMEDFTVAINSTIGDLVSFEDVDLRSLEVQLVAILTDYINSLSVPVIDTVPPTQVEQPKPVSIKARLMRTVGYFMFGITLTDSGREWMSNMTDEDLKTMREFFGVKSIAEVNVRTSTWYMNMKGF